MQRIHQLYEHYLQHPVVVTDSRKIVKGCLYFALKGERFNGNHYANEAIEKGAALAIIDEVAYQKNEQYFLVKDVLVTLQQLATYHRDQFQIPVIAITGSNGKTTTKELVSTVLASHYRTHFTSGNFNNHIGVPLTLLAMPASTEVAIIEMGANHVGEIAFLCNIAKPTHGLITNIGKAHLEGFGGIEGVKKGKSELYKHLAAHNGVAFINQEEAFLEDLSENIKWKIFYKRGTTPTSHRIPFEIQLLQETPFIQAVFTTDDAPITINSHLIGLYNFNNIMTASVLGIYFKVPSRKIKKAIEAYVPTNNRSQLVKKGTNTFILDAYNANPSSMQNALLHFKELKAKHKIAILGAMKELGDYSTAEHQSIIQFAKACDLDQIILVGKEYEQSEETGFQSVDELKDWFITQNFEQTHFLIKGSRSIGLEQLLNIDLS